ncbi:putative thioesterase [Bradyrhizobium sp. JR3.5]
MTIPKALPPGVDHRAASEHLANATESHVKAVTAHHTAPRPAGTKATATVEIPAKSLRSGAAQ